MNVHIIWPTPNGDRILDRLARTLAEGTGWPVGERPDPTADLNYFMVYIDYAQRFSDWHKTPLAAYFSHYEPDAPYKRFWWETAAQAVDIKTITASQYRHDLPGKVVKVIPPIEPIFEIRERKQNKLPRIGVSGFVDGKTRRKGEYLVAQLAYEIEGQAEVVASGRGWPARIVNEKLSGLPAFYNSLDLYLCTSTIEGIPMPPLEALACGVPVVIPSGVGMLDDLPDIPGIVRFKPDSYEGMRMAIDQVLEGSIDRESLRAAVAGYTPEAWRQSHVSGFEAGFSVLAEACVQESDRHGKRGVYYVAYGKPARDCAAGAIASFKTYMPDIPTALVSDAPLGPEDIFIEHPDEDIGGRAAKVKIADLAPDDWQYILYLDADTEVIADISYLYQILEDGWDMVICKNPGRFHIAREMARSDNKEECELTFRTIGSDQVLQLNGGVFAFQRNARTRAFFTTWHQEWLRYGKRDQGALLRALWAHPIKLFVLGNEWNCITRYDSPETSAGILHYPMTARRWRGVVHYRLDDPQAWQAVKEFEAQQ